MPSAPIAWFKDLSLSDVGTAGGYPTFTLVTGTATHGPITLSIPARHNALNAAAVALTAGAGARGTARHGAGRGTARAGGFSGCPPPAA